MCFSSIFITNKYKKPTLLHIYHFLYVLCLILFIFLLEKYIEKEYILSIVLIIFIINFSLEIYSFLFNLYNICGFILFPFLGILASLICLYFFMFRDIYIIIYISAISLYYLLYSTIIVYMSFIYCSKDEYIRASLIFNFALFTPIILTVFICKHIFKKIKESFNRRLNNLYDFNLLIVKMFKYLILELIVIIFFTCLGMYLGFSEIVIESSIATFVTITVFMTGLFSTSVIYLTFCDEKDKEEAPVCLGIPSFLFHCVSIIFYLFLLTGYTEKLNILIILILVFIDYFSIEFYSFLFKCFIGLPIVLLIVNSIALINIYFFWTKDINIILISIVGVIIILYSTIMIFIIKEKFDGTHIIKCAIIFDNTIFCIPYYSIGFLGFFIWLLFNVFTGWEYG